MSNIHYKAFERIKSKKNYISRWVLGCTSVTILLLIIQIISLEFNSQPTVKIISYVGLVLTAITSSIEIFNKDDLSLLMHQHRSTAEKYKCLRNEYMCLIENIMSNSIIEKESRNGSDSLQRRYSAIGENAPETTGDDYTQAQLGLGLLGNSDEEFTWGDKEIDKFLPEMLRLVK